MSKKILFFIVTILCFNIVFATNVLFLSYDYGDTNAFKELFSKLKKVNYEIIGIGKAKDLFTNNVVNDAKCLQDFNNDDLIKSRATRISKKNLDCLKNSLNSKPDIIVSGMSSAALAEILNSFKDVKKIAYYDNFDPYPKNDSKYYTHDFIKTVYKPLDKLLISAKVTENSFLQKHSNLFKAIEVVGNPSILEWQRTNNCLSKENLLNELEVPKDKKVIIFAGDTTDDYKEAFYNFATAIKNSQSDEIIVSYHPKTTGDFERNVKEVLNIDNMIIADADNKDYSTICLSTLGPLFVVHKSSMGVQALSIPKNVIYIADNKYENKAIKCNLADLVYSPEDISNSIKDNYSKEPTGNFYEVFGVPKDSIKTFTNAILH
ncbi:hypothetical protein [Francisella adeliensis]|uniref:UDP-N-acetylglucosamine 2-epimerase domain-containing protein n=1 Tax=Francisella adeliensis TaxID=2007306 RepID=A0A2Z4XZE6_9GAMM|nr:hypothetical protein [Francisella adeliensis]AXA34149.1 hypothetical protein CDH04_06910 [Francisella adeliensis]MBK2085923.1 hypothetical protein [Francisella adeliensis]MBK2095910.1 hypothetical protein [Francisella adeliensis]QIW12393.1 hypothetical protein FZC43_06910 [Francisella adeliensis]QIW14267.1 hypothetical protein FZC44_06910 [Francisella adeliensis]